MTLDQSLANLQHQADRLAGHFSAIADRIEAGEGTFRAVKDAAGQMSRTELVYDPNGGHFDHSHQGYHGEGAMVEMAPAKVQDARTRVTEAHNQALPLTAPQGAAPSSAPPVATSTASAVEVEVEGPGVAAPEAPRPAAPNPFEQTPPALTGPPAEKKKGRRTHDQLAEDNGVTLDAVKAWLGPNKKVTKTAIEEYASLARANAVGETPAQAATPAPQQPTAGAYPGTNAGPESQPAPVHAAPLPTTASDPLGSHPVTGQPGAPVTTTQQWATGPDGQPLPVSQPVAQAQAAVAPTPANPWEGGDAPVTDWSPFSG